MQVAQTTPATPGALLGVVDIKRRTDAFLFAGDQLGKRDGYASLGNAIRALHRLTEGAAPAGFVTYDAGRFFTHALGTSNTAARDVLGGYHLGRSWKNERGVRMLPSVLAVVDGAALVMNDTKATRISSSALKARAFFD